MAPPETTLKKYRQRNLSNADVARNLVGTFFVNTLGTFFILKGVRKLHYVTLSG